MNWTLHTHLELPSLNVLLRKYRNPHARRKLRDDWTLAMKIERSRRAIPDATGKRRVRVVRLMGARAKRYDADNLCGGAKVAIDALVKAGLLVDDSERFVEVTYEQVPHEPVTGTRIEIWEVP